jgi:hypothetical protein
MNRTYQLGLAALLALVALCSGCGYGTHSLMREDIKTVHVEFFGNDTYWHGLEVPLTRAIVDEVKLRTPLLLASEKEADSVLSGALVDIDESSNVKDEGNRILIRRLTLKVRFRWRDRLAGVDIVPEQVVTETVQIAPTLEYEAVIPPRDLDSQRQPTPFGYAFQRMAQRVVERMEKSW